MDSFVNRADVLAKQGRWSDAAQVYRRAIDCDGDNAAARLGFARAARVLLREQGTPDAELLLSEGFELIRGQVALRRFLDDRYGGRPVDVESRPLLGGRAGSAYVGEHRIRDARSHAVESVVQKVPLHGEEVRALERLRPLQDRPTAGVLWPKLLAIYEIDAVSHLFLEHVSFTMSDLKYPVDQLDRICEIYAGVAGLLDLEIAHEIREHPTYFSEKRLQAAARRIRASHWFPAIHDQDPTATDDLDALESAVPEIAAAARSLPSVFSHNDANPSNVMFMRDRTGDIESGMFLDWGMAGPNLVGAEIYYILSLGNLSTAERDLVVSYYHRALESRFQSLTRAQVEFGALLYSFVRSVLRFESRSMRLHLRRALSMGRTAADLAREVC